MTRKAAQQIAAYFAGRDEPGADEPDTDAAEPDTDGAGGGDDGRDEDGGETDALPAPTAGDAAATSGAHSSGDVDRLAKQLRERIGDTG